MQGLHVGLNLAVAIALHNIPEVQISTIQLLSL
jgi:zinc transporter ZupT